MAHELELVNGQASFVEFSASGKSLAWHGLGKQLTSPPDSQTAMAEANMNWEVVKVPVSHPVEIDADGGKMTVNRIIPGIKSVQRKDNGNSLGVVSDRYQPVQNKECFSFLDSLCMDGILRYETAGVLGQGERVFMAAQMSGDWQVGGDKMGMYLLCFNSHDGSSGLEVIPTTVRVVCANTLRMARASGKGMSFRHALGIKDKMAAAEEIFSAVNKNMDEWVSVCNKMNEIRFGQSEFVKMCEVLYPLDKDAAKLNQERTMERRDTLLATWKGEKTQPKNHDSVWGALNAVTYHADHGKFIFKGNATESKFLRATEGEGNNIKVEAWKHLSSLVPVAA